MIISICDDDDAVIQELHSLLEEYFSSSGLEKPVIHMFSDGARLAAVEEPGDIVFLDIEMPHLNGIEAAEAVHTKNKHALIIILTSFPGYLDDAMRVNVFRYLSKPIDKDRLFRNLRDAIKVHLTYTHTIAIDTKQGIQSVNAISIVMVEKQARKTIVYTTKQKFESPLPIQYYIERLPHDSFCQTHKSFIVNMAHVSDFNHDAVRLCDGRLSAYLTRRKYKDFKNAYLLYLEGAR